MSRKRGTSAAFKLSAVALAVGLTVISGASYAQSNTVGSMYGQVSGSGAVIRIEGVDTPYRREVTTDASGRFNVLALPAGQYKVSLVRDGNVVQSETVTVAIGQGREVSFVESRVEVTARSARIDVTNTNQGAVFTASELASIAVAPTVGAVIQLAPSTVKGDPRYGGTLAPSFGGASASENSFYINGFPVTNPLTQVGFSSLPFFSIKQAEILTGGYGAEFGRSTGGVVNITTRSGTDKWEGGVALSLEPSALRSKYKNIVYPDIPGQAASGTVRQWLQDDKTDTTTVSAYLGGPLIKDKLYMFANLEQIRTKSEGVRVVNTDPTAADVGWQKRTLDQPRALLKFDWNLTENHRLEWTHVQDEPKDTRRYYGFDYATKTHNDVLGGEVIYKSYGPTPIAAVTGGNLDILKYTGNLTNDLVLTALVGQTKINRSLTQVGYNPAFPQVLVTDPAPGVNYVSNQPFTDDVFAPGSYNKNRGLRLDAEWKLNDQHTLRFGIDENRLRSYSGTSTAGGVIWEYASDTCGTALAAPGAPVLSTAQFLNNGTQCYYARSHFFKAINPANVDQSAQYVEDKFQVTKDVLLSLGLRNEAFTNFNDVGQKYVQQKSQIEPRIGASWDVKGDSSLKLFGNVGRYHLQLPANVAIRGAGASSFIDQYFSYTGVDQTTGAPTGATAVTIPFSPDGETGNPKDLGYVAAKDLKSHYQDELALGIEHALSKGLNVGAKVTYRKLKSTLEDFCDPRPFQAWAARNGVATDKFDGTGAFAAAGPAFSCTIINPGVTNRFEMDLNGDGVPENIVLTPQDMAGGQSTNDGAVMPKPIRNYIAIDLFAEHPYDGKWYGKVTYTWSRSRGNTEGQLNSDLGQADPATTVTYDFKELMEYAKGPLPNDRTHVIKAYGFYRLADEWTVGGNLLLASGRPTQCLGKHPDPANLAGQLYGSSLFHYCAPGAVPSVGNADPDPRGNRERLPWTKTLDLNVAYKPAALPGLMLKVDWFNVFNSQEPIQVRERALPANRYHLVENYNPPSYVKLTAQYDVKF